MARPSPTWVRQAFMKQSFMRRRTTAICDCWPGPVGVFTGAFWEEGLAQTRKHQSQVYILPKEGSKTEKIRTPTIPDNLIYTQQTNAGLPPCVDSLMRI